MRKLISLLFLVSVNLHAERRTLIDSGYTVVDGKVKVAFFDADSTLRVSLSGSVSANSVDDVFILPHVAEKLAELTKQGYLISIVSNQGGVSFGFITMEIADGALVTMMERIKKLNPEVKFHSYDFAEGKKGDHYRKPNIGMGKALEKNLNQLGYGVDWKNSFMVGDSLYKKGVDTTPDGKAGIHFSNSDRYFAENLGIDFHDPADFFGWREQGVDLFSKLDQVKAYYEKIGVECPILLK